MRGIEAIKEFFRQNDDENEEDAEEEKQASRIDQSKQSKMQSTLKSQNQVGSLKREEKKEEALADQLHVLNEEFAQAIIFKRNELLEAGAGEGRGDKPNDIYD